MRQRAAEKYPRRVGIGVFHGNDEGIDSRLSDFPEGSRRETTEVRIALLLHGPDEGGDGRISYPGKGERRIPAEIIAPALFHGQDERSHRILSPGRQPFHGSDPDLPGIVSSSATISGISFFSCI